jgi:hypothetical protein
VSRVGRGRGARRRGEKSIESRQSKPQLTLVSLASSQQTRQTYFFALLCSLQTLSPLDEAGGNDEAITRLLATKASHDVGLSSIGS